MAEPAAMLSGDPADGIAILGAGLAGLSLACAWSRRAWTYRSP